MNPSDHELNEVLARVAGVELHESEKGWMYWYNFGHGESLHVWNPLHDANQMEKVEEALAMRADMVEFYVAWVPKRQMWEAFLAKVDTVGYPVFHEDKKRAFALAVYAMEQSQKGTT